MIPKAVVTAKLQSLINEVNAYVSVPVPPPPPPAPSPLVPMGMPGNYTLLWKDEFDGTTLNPVWNTNWLGTPGTVTRPPNSDEIVCYDPAMVKVKEGCLHLTIEKLEVPKTFGTIVCTHRSGIVESANRREFLPAPGETLVFESRIMMPMAPYAPGVIPYNWGADWLNGHHTAGKWADRAESDTMENLSGGPAWHYHSKYPAVSVGQTPPARDWSGWHVYAEVWTQGSRTYWYDGKQVGAVTANVLNYPQYMILNYGSSLKHGGPVMAGQTMMVDYKRVFKKVG